ARRPEDIGPPRREALEPRRVGLFRELVNDFVLLLTEVREEHFEQLRLSFPALPPVTVEGVDLIQADLDQALTVAAKAALDNRLDLLNARAQLVDYWRQIAIQANSLLGVLNIRYNSESFTPPGKDQRFSCSGDRTWREITLNGELPLVRRLERNNYRAALIAYQRERRVLQATEDFILADVRSQLRQLRLLAENYRIQQRQLELAYYQVEASLETFFAPSYPSGATAVGTVATGGTTGGSTAGSAAALTQQLINAQNSLLRAQNNLYQVWINYLIFRMQLYRDLELMPLDPRGV